MNQIEDMIDRAAREYFPEPKTGIPAAGTYFAALLVSIVLIMPRFTSSGDRRLFLLFVAAIIAMLLVRLWMVAVLFVLIQLKLAIRESPRGVSELDGGEIMFGIGVLIMIIAGSRLVALMAPMVSSDASIFALFRTAYRRLAGKLNEDSHAVMPTRRGATFSISEGLTGLARAVGAVTVAAVLLSQFPLDPSTQYTLGLYEWAARTISIGVVLIIAFQITRVVLGTLSWRRLTKAEARTYLRSELAEWSHRDVRGVVVRQVNKRRDRRRQASGG